MQFDLDQRTATLSVGEFSAFTTGPRDAGSGQQGIWRAQLGTHWHNELRLRAAAETPATQFEIPITGQIVHHGWVISLTGRIDQLVRSETAVTLREIKTVTRPLPADEGELRADYPDYFAQLSAYAALLRLTSTTELSPVPLRVSAELVFVETSSGLAQTLSLTPADETFFRVQLERLCEFLNLRLRARERLRHLSFRPAFATPRLGQETTATDLTKTFERQPVVMFEAPTGFGKTGVLLEFALGQLKAGHFDRALYLTSKSTGQLQVVSTLTRMTSPEPSSNPIGYSTARKGTSDATAGVEGTAAGELAGASGREEMELGHRSQNAVTAVAAWHVRNKSEHCINHTFHCVRENCAYLDQLEARWPQSGLARFYLDEKHARDLDTLREAGRHARICPYEITRASLAFNDVWIADYNYVFAPANRGIFYLQPGFDPARTLLMLDEAHNLPTRVADSYSHLARGVDARTVLAELDHISAPKPIQHAWESWTLLLSALRPVDVLDPALEADVTDSLSRIVDHLTTMPLDYAALGPEVSEQLWKTQALAEWLNNHQLKRLLWCPAEGELSFTCIDAADAIGATLREFGGVVFASATFGPEHEFAEACGLSEPRATAKPSPARAVGDATPSSRSAREDVANEKNQAFSVVRAATPWRDQVYDVAVDARVDTTFQHRSRYYAITAATIAALHEAAHVRRLASPASAAGSRAVAVFFPSYAYAETVSRELDRLSPLRVALQPRIRDLATQAAWMEESLALSDTLFLVLGSSFAESIDLLGGRVTHAMVVGPALPEVNAVQRARLAEFAPLGRAAAFRRVYQIPGMTKVNQALGRLVRAPGQRARVLLHCRRFLDPTYASLLARDYQFGANVLTDEDLANWLAGTESVVEPRL